jgi:hypothetical protein
MVIMRMTRHGKSLEVRFPKQLTDEDGRSGRDEAKHDPKAFWLKIDAFGGEDLFQDGPPEDPPVKPDPRKFLDP